ncbi:SDR family oxidoreductase [Teredinibacter haidensis]|uniref:SDR family oxidoreductase n=1 Tax=Teredinibacter haidensis TaxID=2731755 RepID=UPI000948E598|nr:SDR family oxidoreductase [Teredinibacter haidensis]
MPQTVLITGASSGFGEACARKFAQHGYSLVLFARRLERLETLKNELQSLTSIYIAQLDITDGLAVDEALRGLPEQFKNIDILVNNAGLALGLEPANKSDLDDWQTMVDTNISGLLRITHRILPTMVERNTGHIINIASTAGSWPYPGGNTYGATKAFVKQFTRGLKADLLGTPIRVTDISPGMAETEFSDVRFKHNTQKANAVYKSTEPLMAKDIADIIYWVTSVPAHVNINSLEVMPVSQAWGSLAVSRTD